MKNITFALIPLVLMCFIGTAHANPMINVNGTVHNSAGKPLQLEFDFSNATQFHQQITSTSDGKYGFTLNQGLWNWKFSSINQQPNMPRFFSVDDQLTLSANYSDTLIPQVFTMTGQLKDNTGAIISGGTVDSGICNISIGKFNGTQEDVVTINSTGYYTLHLLPSTCDSIKVVTSSGFTFFPNSGRTITINSNSTNNITLAPTVTVSGTLTDSTGNPVSATVQFVGTDFVESSQTDSSGHYSFNIPTGTYTVKFSQNNANNNLPRFFDIEKSLTANSDQTNDVKLNDTSISGTVTFKSATVNVRNNLSLNGYSGFSLDRINSDSNGHITGNLLQSNVNQVTVQNYSGDGSTVTCNISNGVITC